MTNDEKAALDQLRDNYNSIHDNLDELLQACGNDVSLKHQLGDAMGEALQSYIRAQTHILDQNGSTILGINKAASKAQEDIDHSLQSLKDIKSTLNTLTNAVKVVGILVAALP